MQTHLGRLELSLCTSQLAEMKEFYQRLGFEIVGGSEDAGWLELASGPLRLGIYQGHILRNQLSFFSRDIAPVAQLLKERRIHDGPVIDESDGSQSITIQDPDGNVLYFNTVECQQA